MSKKKLNLIPNSPADGFPKAKKRNYLNSMLRGDNETVCRAIVDYLRFFEVHHYSEIGTQDMGYIDEFVSSVFAVITDQNFKLGEDSGKHLISCGHMLSNIVATSSYRTTDGPLLHIMRQQNNYAKLLFLYNSRCTVYVPVKTLFDVNADISSLWYNTYILGDSNPTLIQQANLMRHMESMDERWVPPNERVSVLYFTCTYYAPNSDRKVKGIINKACKTRSNINVTNTPKEGSIAIVTAKWHRNHAVYKSCSPLVDQLKGKYKLTLIHLGTDQPPLVEDGFDAVYKVAFDDHKLVLPPEVANNDYQAVYYPDIGMNDESMWMSNCRLAPIQAMGYGHPATSGDNSEIDYFIGGTIEKDVANRYSEQMILIPGLAQHPAWPSYERKNNWQPSDIVRINCVWGPDKYNFAMLSGLAEVSKKATSKHEWHLYPSPGINRYGALIPFKRSVEAVLPNVIIHSDLEYYEYMEDAEQHDFSVNSYPFGGYNTVVESLFLGLPMVTIEGDRFYNRAASYLLRKVGLDCLSTTVPDAFVDKCVRLIDDPDHRAAMRTKVAECDLKTTLFDDPGDHFLKAFEYILENHPIKSDTPIIIGE